MRNDPVFGFELTAGTGRKETHIDKCQHISIGINLKASRMRVKPSVHKALSALK